KSTGNITLPEDVLIKYNHEILRLAICMSNYSDDCNLTEDHLKQTKIIYLKLRNTLKFIIGNLYDFTDDLQKKAIIIKDIDKINPDNQYFLYNLYKKKKIISRLIQNNSNNKLLRKILNFISNDL